jgi:hypothetical protein
LRRIGDSFAGASAVMGGEDAAAGATLATNASRAQHHLFDALHLLGGLSEAKAAQLRELQLQVLDKPPLAQQIDALCGDELVLGNQQSL